MVKKQKQLIKITQVKSRIGYKPKARATLDALGLRKMNQSVEKVKTPEIEGMIEKIPYLLKVDEL